MGSIDEIKSPSGSSVDDSSGVTPDGSQDQSKQTVNYETYQKSVSQERNLRERLSTMEGQLNTFKTAEKDREDKRVRDKEDNLTRQGEYKKLVEIRDQKIKELENAVNSAKEDNSYLTGVIVEEKRARAFKDNIAGKLRRPEFISHANLESIIINPETGEVDKESTIKVCNEFMESYGNSLVDAGSFGLLPNGAPRTATGTKLTQNQWESLPLKEMRKRISDVIKE